jgi:putative cell wall-binding protein
MNIKKLVCMISIGLCLGFGNQQKVSAEVSPQRIWGNNRYDTSISICKNGWKDTSDYAIIVSGKDFGDAICAAPLAKKYNAPILLASKNKLDNQSSKESLSSELNRLKVKKVFIIGGKGVISDKLESEVKKKGIQIERISGVDRYATSIEVAKKVGINNGAFLTIGTDFADAVSAAPIAAAKQMPIILLPNAKSTKELESYIKNANVSKAYILGDNNLIKDDIVKYFKDAERIIGKDKYERNINIINKFEKDINFSTTYLSSVSDYADALSGAALASLTKSPIVLVSNNIPKNVQEFLNNKLDKMYQINILGGEGVVSTNQLSKYIPISNNKYVSNTLTKAYINNQNINSVKNKSEISFNFSTSGFSKEDQENINKVLPYINNSKINIVAKTNTNKEKTTSDGEIDITIDVAGMKVDTTAWVFADFESNEPKMLEIVKIPKILSDNLPEEFKGKEYMVIDVLNMNSKLADNEELDNVDYTKLVKFSKEFQPKFIELLNKWSQKWNPGIECINYKGLFALNTMEGKKYVQTYEFKLDDKGFKDLISNTVNNCANDEESMNLIKEFIINTIDFSQVPNKDEEKKAVEEVFNNIKDNPKEALKDFNNFMNIIKDLKILGDKGIDITYYIHNGYIIGESGVVDLQLDLSKIEKMMSNVESNLPEKNKEDIKGLIDIVIKYSSENYDINKPVNVTMPELTKENSFDYVELLKNSMD